MRARVVTAGFGDYTAGLRCTQPRFPPAMRYALMERWNDCTHTIIFGFDEMTLRPVDYAAITGLRFTGPVPPLDARCRPRGIRRSASSSGLPDPTLVGSTLMFMSGTWRSVNCEGIRLVSLAL
ncbi:hypothetical protein JCGZ_05064 [Jatropha curcas]|uniref:Aminotransferase-like plant mobile domain-containing protein n=1 Tax=Jatropha curcas TaxID=180498 RepID=A0A067J9W4_JATCU|nr:hypothetical protein JCGZ_05064 [Jatropha curcas]